MVEPEPVPCTPPRVSVLLPTVTRVRNVAEPLDWDLLVLRVALPVTVTVLALLKKTLLLVAGPEASSTVRVPPALRVTALWPRVVFWVLPAFWAPAPMATKLPALMTTPPVNELLRLPRNRLPVP